MKRKKQTRSASIRALSGVPTPTATNFTPAASNFGLHSFRVEASSQLIKTSKIANKSKQNPAFWIY